MYTCGNSLNVTDEIVLNASACAFVYTYKMHTHSVVCKRIITT